METGDRAKERAQWLETLLALLNGPIHPCSGSRLSGTAVLGELLASVHNVARTHTWKQTIYTHEKGKSGDNTASSLRFLPLPNLDPLLLRVKSVNSRAKGNRERAWVNFRGPTAASP